MATLGEILGNAGTEDYDPEALKKLLGIKSDLPQLETRIPSSARDAATTFENMPRTAAESAEVFESMPQSTFDKAAAERAVSRASIPGKSAADSAKVFQNMPKTAAESAEVLEGAPELTEAAPNYSKLFGKQVAQDIVDQASVPGKSAADSAKVFTNATGEGLAEGKGIVPYSQIAKRVAGQGVAEGKGIVPYSQIVPVTEKIAPSMLSELAGAAGKVASKAALPLTVAYELGKSGPMDENEDKIMEARQLAARGMLPNGGMSEEDAIRQYGGPVASEGFNPNAPSGIDTLISQSASSRSAQRGPAGSSSSGGGRSPASFSDVSTPSKPGHSLTDTIATLLGNQQKDLDQANDYRDKLQLVALLNDAGNTIGAALNPMSKIQPDGKFTEKMLQMANKPIEDIRMKKAIEREGLQDALLQVQAKKQIAYQDANSPESISFRKSVMAIDPNIAKTFGADFNNVTAADRDLIFDPIKLKETIEMRKQVAAQNALYRQISLGKKSDDKQLNAFQKIAPQLNSTRGMDPSTKQSYVDNLNAEKALEALSPYMKDLNNVPPNIRALFSGEMGKISTGGVPQSEFFKDIDIKTVRSAYEKSMQGVTGTPRGEHVGPFLQNYVRYLKGLQANAQRHISQHVDDVVGPYTEQDIGPQKYKYLQDLKQRHISGKAFTLEDLKDKPLDNNDQSQSAQQPGLSAHPKDSEAIDWAKKNLTNPQYADKAAQILKMNGVQ